MLLFVEVQRGDTVSNISHYTQANMFYIKKSCVHIIAEMAR